MSELIDDLLKLSRIGRAELHREAVDLAPIASSVAEELRHQQPDRSVDVHVAGPLAVEADPAMMRVVFENLLGYAWKFTAHTALPRIDVGVERRDEHDVYFVRDNGAGFNMAHAGNLFRPFQRLHREADFPGTGIGLATVHRILDRHGGRVWAEGAVGAGAAVYFTLSPKRAR